VSLIGLATDLLHALAASDLDRVSAMCAPDVLLYGTDEGERWDRRDELLRALEAMRSLQLRADWSGPPAAGFDWVAGVALYTSPSMAPTAVRITMVFRDALLVHGHFSVEAPAVSPS
jgi:hypothetical protein